VLQGGGIRTVCELFESDAHFMNREITPGEITNAAALPPQVAGAVLHLGSSVPANAAAQTQQFRSQVGHISRQSGIFFGGTVFSIGTAYIFKVYLARVLGAHDLGVYALGMTLVGFLGIFNGMGLPQSAVRFVASYAAANKFRQLHALLWRGATLLLAVNALFAVIFLALGRWIAIRFYHAPVLVPYLPWFALTMVTGAVAYFYGKVLAGYRELGRRTLITNFVGSPLMMLLTVLLISRGLGLQGYLMAQIFSGAVVCLLLLYVVRELTPTAARFSANRGARLEREVWSFSAAMLGIGLMEFLMVQVDKVALGFYRGAREVGIYSVAAAVVAYVPLALSSVNQIFSPTISDLHTRGERALLGRLFQSLTKWVVGLTLPLACVIIVFARPLMRIFGPDFEAGWPILIIGTLGQLVNCGVGSVGYLLLMSGNEKRLIKVQAVMAAVMVVLSAALVPIWGIVGAAVAAAITNVGMNAWNLLQVRLALGLSPYNRSYFHVLPPAAAAIGVTLLLKKNSALFGHDWVAVGVAIFLAYMVFGAIVLVFGLNEDDRLIANAIWLRVRGAVGRGPSEVAP
jgi:O-antigen/teichoic acid export membrane protein